MVEDTAPDNAPRTPRKTPRKPATYAEAGVSIAGGNKLVSLIAPLVRATSRPGANSEFGGFGAVFDPKAAGFTDPLLVSSTDGVGTKLKLAQAYDHHDTIGQDLVAMCVNDLIVQGAEPLFFLDYFATGHLDNTIAQRVIAGIARACHASGCALIGGETAEMPGMYEGGTYDLAGFAVGAVERHALLTGDRVAAGDTLIGIASSGAHSNGFSLIRRLVAGLRLEAPAPFSPSRSLIAALMEPTRLYIRSLLPILKVGKIHALAHITGGGLLENVPRVLPKGLRARIAARSWTLPPLFAFLQERGAIEPAELARTFNCGIGMVAITAPDEAEEVLALLRAAGEHALRIGEVETGTRGVTLAGEPQLWGAKDGWTVEHDA